MNRLIQSWCVMLGLGLGLDCAKLNASELNAYVRNEQLIIKVEGHEFVYRDLLGKQGGFYGAVIPFNGKFALSLLGRDRFLFTLDYQGGRPVIDCIYADARNKRNGARVTAGACGFDVGVTARFADIAHGLSTYWKNTVYGFNTRPIFENAKGEDFLLGYVGDVAVYDRYGSTEDMINSSPRKFVKTHRGCFYFGDATVYLMFSEEGESPEYLDVETSVDPTVLTRLGIEDLRKKAVDKCS